MQPKIPVFVERKMSKVFINDYSTFYTNLKIPFNSHTEKQKFKERETNEFKSCCYTLASKM